MSTFDRLAGFADSISASKQADVTQASNLKKAEQGIITPDTAYQIQAGRAGDLGTDAFAPGSPAYDFSNLSPMELIGKYGLEQGMQLMNTRANAADQVYRDSTASRTGARALLDTATGAALGFGNAFGGIAALGAGLINDNAGAAIAGGLGHINEAVRNTQSDALNARRKVVAAQNQIDALESENIYKQDIKDGSSNLVASLSRIGRDAINSVGNTLNDSTVLSDGIAEGIGSLFAAGPLMKGVSAIGRAALPANTARNIGVAAAIDSAAGTQSLARVASTAGRYAPSMIAIGAMEAGGAYQQTAEEILKMPFKELQEKSPTYQQHIKDGLKPEEARRQTASETGLIAAGIQAPIAAATGPLVARFEMSPTRVGSVASALSNIGRETIEEGIQGGSSQFAQNVAQKQNIDKNQDLAKGVGEQIGLGALYGLGAAAAVQAPGLAGKSTSAALAPAVRVTMAGLRAAGNVGAAATKPARDALARRGERVMEQNEQASPISDNNIQTAAQEATVNAAQAEDTLYQAISETETTDAEKEAAYLYASDLVNSSRFEPTDYDSAPQIVRDAVAGSANKVEAIQRLADLVNSTSESNPTDMMNAAYHMYEAVAQFEGFINRDPAALNNIAEDSPANAVLDQYSTLSANIQNTPKVLRAFRTIANMVNEAAEKGRLEANDATLTQDDANVITMAAEVSPDKISDTSANIILKHADEGKIQLSNRQRVALVNAATLFKGAREFDAEAEKLGLRPQDIVSKQIKTDETRSGEGQYSTLQHANRIRSAYNSGNLELAGAYLQDLMQFAQHMQNKVGALNQHALTGESKKSKSVHYQALSPTREWVNSKVGLGVNFNSTGSIRFAQQVGMEAKFVGDVANALASAFPELKVSHVNLTQLDSRLNKKADQVVKEYRQGNRDVASSQQETKPANEVKETPAKTQEVEPTVTPERKTEEVIKEKPANDKSDFIQKVETLTLPTEEVAEPQTAMDKAYPTLIGSGDSTASGVKNYFKIGFKLPTEARTRLIGSEKPLADMANVFSNRGRYESFTGTEPNLALSTPVLKRYRDYMKHGEAIASVLSDRMDAFITKNKVASLLEKGEEPNRWMAGKLLNIVENDGKGLVYNPELLQTAVLAGLQWRLTGVQNSSIKDAKDVASIVGIDQADLPTGMVEMFNNKLTVLDAVSAISRKVEQYWGLSKNKDAPLGYTKGIPSAMATELLSAFIESGDVTVTQVNMSEYFPGNKKKINLYEITPLDVKDPINKYLTAIEETVLFEPEDKLYFGNDIPPVSPTQLRNPSVKNTPQQRKALLAEAETSFFIHDPMVKLYEALGEEGIVNLVGVPNANPETMNVNTLRSAEGKNLGITMTYKHLFDVIQQTESLTDDPTNMPMHFGYNMSRVGRMQMQGKYTVQSSKLMREAILPTRTVVDLSNENSKAFSDFQLGLAQGIGIKVHNMSREAMASKLTEALNGRLKPAIDILVDFNNGDSLPDNAVDTFKTALGNDTSFVGLMALNEYARYLNAEDKSKFSTPLYVEADGVTNGPLNAMMLLSKGEFNKTWLKNVGKGGVFFGKPGKTINEHRSTVDRVDLYEETANSLTKNMSGLLNQYRNDAVMSNQIKSVVNLINMFIPSVAITEEGQLEIGRGATKNPLTITIYGSGERGIAGNIASELMEVVYQNFSDVLAKRVDNPELSPAMAMFGDKATSEEHAKQMLDSFLYNMGELTTKVPRRNKKGQLFLADTKAIFDKRFDPKNFTINPTHYNNLLNNITELFVKPMREAIASSVGEDVLGSASLIQKATQAQSIVLQDLFNQAVEAKLAEKAKDPNWKKADFLSQSELDTIEQSLNKYSPIIETGQQSFYVAGSESTELANQYQAYSLDDAMRIPMTVYAPSQAGVSGIPYLVIGMGDGMMMQTISTMKDAPKNTLKIFDGMNIGLDQLDSASMKANEAAYTAWDNNPVKEVYENFRSMMSVLDPETLTEKAKETFYNLVEQDTAQFINTLANASNSVEARRNVMQQVNMTVDQMAAVGSPYVNQGTVTLEGLTEDQQINLLNKMYREELAKLGKTKAEAKTPNKSEFSNVGYQDSTGARILNINSVRKLAKDVNMSTEQAATLEQIFGSSIAKNYKIVFGNVDQITQYTAEHNLTDLSTDELGAARDGDIHGWTNFDDQTIYLVSPSMETLIHELIHAATFEKVLSHYTGDTTDSNVALAIGNLEQLMEQFTNLNMRTEDSITKEAYDSALYTINDHLNNGFVEPNIAKAAALNEFMAWGLANRALAKKQKKTSSLVQLAKDVYEAIKTLIWGNKKAPKVAEDMFSNLLFNSAIVMSNQPTVSAVNTDTTLFHSTTYGDSDRLTSVSETMNQLVGNYLNTTPVERFTREGKVTEALITGVEATKTVMAHGFNMNMQERGVFQDIVSVLATEATINPNALSRAQELYSHVTKNIKVEDFMTDPDSTNPADRYYAQEKFNTILGNNLTAVDKQGRSVLLPVFIGLATVDTGFRSILEKMPVPKADKKLGNTLDTLLTNAGTQAMESLNKRLAGDTKSNNVQESIDALTDTIAQSAQEKESFYDSVATPTGNMIDRANQYVIDGIDRLADATIDKADTILAQSNKPFVKATANAARLMAAIATEKNGEKVAAGIMTAMNQGKAWQPFHDLVNDIAGRTKSNASVYDLIKAVRSQVQQDRQQFREQLPTIIVEKFTRQLSREEWGTLHTGLGKTDLSVLRESMTLTEIREILSDSTKLDSEINNLESILSTEAKRNWPRVEAKAKQLANYMVTGVTGSNLLRNAEAVSRLLGERSNSGPVVNVKQLDKLISLYALESVSAQDKTTLASLAETETTGMDFVLSYLVGQRVEEQRKIKLNDRAKFNHYKGYIPTESQQGVNMIVASDSEFASLRDQSFVRIGDYTGSNLERFQGSQGYYFSPVAARAPYSQGIMQNVNNTSSGVDSSTGFTSGTMIAGRIVNKADVERITKLRQVRTEKAGENLLPVYDVAGNIVAYERSINPEKLKHLNQDNHLAKMIGVWRGRQVEEAKAQSFNDVMVERLHDMYTKDIKADKANQSQYVNLFNFTTDNVLADAIKLMNQETKNKANDLFGNGEFWVRRDMLNDTLGYRSASLGDAWTGNSRWSPETLSQVKKMFIGAMGKDAYRYVMNTENTIQNLVKDAKTLIVVKSLVVPAINFLANIYQLIGRGVPVKDIATGLPKKTSEINQYLKSRSRQIEAEAELRATANPNQQLKLKAEIQSITDSHKRLSVWPLLQAGEFSSIADAGIGRDEVLITEGRVQEYLDRLANKLPKPIRNAGRYALITKDTALFQGIQKTVEYSDFVAKALIFDELTKRKGLSHAEALGRVTEEFINYDRLPGRFRGYMESMGLMWFYNFKIRSTKVALSMIRNNPVHTMIALTAPAPTMFGNIGIPIQDNLFSAMAEGRLDYSLGFGQGLRAPSLNPWHNLIE